MDEKWRDALVRGIAASANALSEKQGGGPLMGFALLTDLDARYLLAAGYTEDTRAAQPSGLYGFEPYEWPQDMDGLREASQLNAQYVDSQYETEDDEIEGELHPDDDHRRPWKKGLWEGLVEVLAAQRATVFSDDTFLMVFADDVNEEMRRSIRKGIHTLNGPDRYAEWRAVYGAA